MPPNATPPRRPPRSLLGWARRGIGGLRPRLVLAFVVVAALAALTATVLAYRESRIYILKRAQDSVVTDFRDRLALAAREFDVPPDRGALERFAREVEPPGPRATVVAQYGDLTVSTDPAADLTRLSPELQDRVRSRARTSFQRVDWHGEPWLVVGTPVTFAGSGQPSGVEAYAIVSLAAEDRDIDALLRTVRDGLVPVAVAVVVLALLAAGTVLRPVRELGRGARRLASGELGARVKPRGHDELTDLAHTFNHAAEALQGSVAELRDQEALARRFVADVSHELRTPLAAMTMVSAVLDEDADQLPPDTARAARTVSAETAKLTRLVEDLIEISRFDAHAAVLNLGDVDVADAVRASIAVRGWTDEVATDLPAGIRARLDRRRLDVVTANLVGNALRHGAPPVTVALARHADTVVLTVSDHGPGLPPEVRKHVFDRFYKADTARTRSEGSGLGLAIAAENVRLHGGTLTVGERKGGGTVFTLTLPTTQPDDGTDDGTADRTADDRDEEPM
ncbi:HAMP domain-containing sensor histidine kinase [Yinghuangia seranimata]|nr:HAMP domain-containing sensor histidine kinase [Yinghuangia seranimata]MDI2130201.1 HAMP domain-containing sensor histidine kinase [Yinghuangia seranimata]